MAAFNRLMLEDVQVEQYFTMAYAEIDLGPGVARLAQAGHPHPAAARLDGVVDMAGRQGGLPVGLIPGARYEDAGPPCPATGWS
jgi:sigma-B regulation protein RsbU (phosphoserine phosphatase)